MHEAISPYPNSFPDTYQVPLDQFGFEMDMRERYTQQFPEMEEVLNLAIQDVQRASGMNIPKYRVSEADREASDAAGINDELGFLNAPLTPRAFDTMLIRHPVDYSDDQIAAMSDRERMLAEVTHTGHHIVGELPPESRRLIDEIYTLTGATVARSGRDDNETHGHVIRRGEYHGTPVYFQEMYSDTSFHDGQPTFKLCIIGNELAEELIVRPSQAEQREFIEISGIDRMDLRHFMAENHVTRDNYRQIADTVRQAREIIDGDAE